MVDEKKATGSRTLRVIKEARENGFDIAEMYERMIRKLCLNWRKKEHISIANCARRLNQQRITTFRGKAWSSTRLIQVVNKYRLLEKNLPKEEKYLKEGFLKNIKEANLKAKAEADAIEQAQKKAKAEAEGDYALQSERDEKKSAERKAERKAEFEAYQKALAEAAKEAKAFLAKHKDGTEVIVDKEIKSDDEEDLSEYT